MSAILIAACTIGVLLGVGVAIAIISLIKDDE